MRMRWKLALSKFLCLLALTTVALPLGAKLPELHPNDVTKITNKIASSHINFHEVTPELVSRALSNYLEELDPAKTYLHQQEIEGWLNPSEAHLTQITEQFKREDFSAFYEMTDLMSLAIERRRAHIVPVIEQAGLEAEVKSKEFEDLEWAQDMAELTERNQRIHALQSKITSKLDDETQEKFFQRLQKRRSFQEEQVLNTDEVERQNYVLTHVLKATAKSFDSQTAYLTPGEANQFMIDVQLRLFGIGVLMRDDLNGFTIVQVLDNGPADKSGKVKPDDRIIAVDSEPVVGMEITEAVELIRGPENTDVVLTMLREHSEGEAETYTVTLKRGEVVLEESRMEYSLTPYGDGVIATIHFPSFYQDEKSSSADDLTAAVREIEREHSIKGIVLDLRGNTGGILPQAVRVAGLFITKGVVASIVDRSAKPQHLREVDQTVLWDGPLIVLVNKASASAAEIVAQSLQDYGRAIVVGDEHTFGKGSFQVFSLNPSNPNEINPSGEFKVTLGKYYTVSGKTPQLKGVLSDIVVFGPLKEIKIGERFSRFPLESDSIAPQFEDRLEDIPLFQRQQILPFYKASLQKKIDTWTRLIPKLKENSITRLEANEGYKEFLEQLSKNDKEESLRSYLKLDLQKTEAVDIMKDMIALNTSS